MRRWIIASVALPSLVFGKPSPPAERPAEIAARVVLEAPGDGGRSDWVEFHVDGGGVPSMERCERLVEAELHRVYPPTAPIKPRVARPCLSAALPPAGHPSIDAQLLRVREPLPTLDLLSVSSAQTAGHVVRYTRFFSAAECEHRRERLLGLVRGDANKDHAKSALDEEARLNAEQIAKACEDVAPPVVRKPGTKKRGQNPWLERDLSRSRCEQAKRMGEILAHKRVDPSSTAVDPIERVCVRE